MIRARFWRSGEQLTGVEIAGHAGFADSGSDIVCASVTSAVQLVCNAVTEILRIPAAVEVEEDLIRLRVPEQFYEQADSFLQALRLHLELLSQDYPKNLTTTVLEV